MYTTFKDFISIKKKVGLLTIKSKLQSAGHFLINFLYKLGGSSSFDKSIPYLNYNNDFTLSAISAGCKVYNRPEFLFKVANKSIFWKSAREKSMLIKSVLNISDIKTLKFPIVAKPDSNHSGKGIVKFNTIEDFNRRDKSLTFDLYQEYHNIKSEYRLFFFRNKCFRAYERRQKSGSLNGKGIEFEYVRRPTSSIPKFESVLSWYLGENYHIDFCALDILVDNKGIVKIIEINSKPGFLYDVHIELYKLIYADFYKKGFSNDQNTEFESIRSKKMSLNDKS